jgi:hypothetical protein
LVIGHFILQLHRRHGPRPVPQKIHNHSLPNGLTLVAEEMQRHRARIWQKTWGSRGPKFRFHMDPIVIQAMAKWPAVPNVYGWLRLDRRGGWLIKGDRIANAGVTAFIGRNYAADERGRWFFQNARFP